MAKTRRAYAGGAISTTTTSSIAASGDELSFTVTAYTGWPYGVNPFYIVVEPGTASEEKILVTRSGSTDPTINIASDAVRGLDGTSAVAHSSGSTVYPVFTAVDADEANELIAKYTTKGDLVVHGASTVETLSVGSNGRFLVADSSAATGLVWENEILVDGSNVVIGDTSASYKLDVNGEINARNGLRVDGTQVGSYLSYTPQLTASVTNPTLGTGGVATGSYCVIDEMVHYIAYFKFGTSGYSAGNGIHYVSLPVAASTSGASQYNLGGGYRYTTQYWYSLVATRETATTCVMAKTTGPPTSTLVSSDDTIYPGVILSLNLMYRKA